MGTTTAEAAFRNNKVVKSDVHDRVYSRTLVSDLNECESRGSTEVRVVVC